MTEPVNDEPELFGFRIEDRELIAQIAQLIRRLLKRDNIAPRHIHSVGRMLFALERLPCSTPNISIDLALKSHYDGNIACFSVLIEDNVFRLETSEWISGPCGGDSLSRINWEVYLGEPRDRVDVAEVDSWMEGFRLGIDHSRVELYDSLEDIDWDDMHNPGDDPWSRLKSDYD
jgi:hypothetical protein